MAPTRRTIASSLGKMPPIIAEHAFPRLSATYITYSGAQRIEYRCAARGAINRERAHPMTGRAGFRAIVRTDRQGWSKHELAHLRSAAKFVRAGRRSIRTDCGVTDEGHPWFVFCADETGEIIAHFARIGSKYIACVPFRSGALTGRILPDLIEQFLQQHKFLPQRAEFKPDERSRD